MSGGSVTSKLVDAVVSAVRGGMKSYLDICMAISGDGVAIDRAIKEGRIRETPNGLEYVALSSLTTDAPKTATDDSSAIIDKKTLNQYPLIIPGLKCRNADQPYPPYRVYTGDESDVKAVADDMQRCGINAHCRQCGKQGKPRWVLIVPTYVRGEYILGQEMTWKD